MILADYKSALDFKIVFSDGSTVSYANETVLEQRRRTTINRMTVLLKLCLCCKLHPVLRHLAT